MPRRSQRKLATQTVGLSLAAPMVVAHRLQRMAASGLNPNARDRREFTRMGAEKVAAFWESWAAMGWAAVQAQQQMWLAAFSAPWRSVATPSRLAADTMRIASRGLAPVHRRAVANAKRLGRVRPK